MRTSIFVNSLGMNFVAIAAGTFTMGSPDNEADRGSDEGPQHQVTLTKGFYMQTTEVTQGQWEAVMGSNPSHFSNSSLSCNGYDYSCPGAGMNTGNDAPVKNVSWDDVQNFIIAMNNRGEGTYRLLTEAEWEYSARAGTTTAYSFGVDNSQLSDYAWHGNNS